MSDEASAPARFYALHEMRLRLVAELDFGTVKTLALVDRPGLESAYARLFRCVRGDRLDRIEGDTMLSSIISESVREVYNADACDSGYLNSDTAGSAAQERVPRSYPWNAEAVCELVDRVSAICPRVRRLDLVRPGSMRPGRYNCNIFRLGIGYPHQCSPRWSVHIFDPPPRADGTTSIRRLRLELAIELSLDLADLSRPIKFKGFDIASDEIETECKINLRVEMMKSLKIPDRLPFLPGGVTSLTIAQTAGSEEEVGELAALIMSEHHTTVRSLTLKLEPIEVRSLDDPFWLSLGRLHSIAIVNQGFILVGRHIDHTRPRFSVRHLPVVLPRIVAAQPLLRSIELGVWYGRADDIDDICASALLLPDNSLGPLDMVKIALRGPASPKREQVVALEDWLRGWLRPAVGGEAQVVEVVYRHSKPFNEVCS